MSPRSRQGWSHYRAAEKRYAAELRRRGEWYWTTFDYRMRQARDCAVRDLDSHLVGACLELQASRWEIAGYQGEVLAALGGALSAYERVEVAEQKVLHCDRVKQRIENWYQVPRVFMSYARRDLRRVRRIVVHLESRQAQVLWDSKMFVPGVDLSRLIAWAMGHIVEPERADAAAVVSDAMRIAGVYLVMWSQTYASRPWTTWELERAFEHVAELRRSGRVGPRVVIVLLDDHPAPARHGDYLWIDLSRGLDASGRDQLWRAITHTELLGPRLAAGRPASVRPRRKR